MPKLREELEKHKDIPCAGKSPLTDRDLMDIVKARREDERNRKPKQIKPVPPFKRNPKHSKTEYERQLKNQETAINNMTVKDWLKNKDDFRNNRQKHDKFAAQKRKEYREKIKQEKINEYKRNNGREKDLDQKAENYANSYLKGKSALHNPDGIAGGRADQISGMGDSRVNSSIGSQWQHGRADAIENQIKQQYGIPPKTVDDIPATDMMNIKLI